MFSFAWGNVSTRELCIINSQNVYKRLVPHNSGESLLSFDILALIARLQDQTLDVEKLKELIRLLRPDRDGKLGMLGTLRNVTQGGLIRKVLSDFVCLLRRLHQER